MDALSFPTRLALRSDNTSSLHINIKIQPQTQPYLRPFEASTPPAVPVPEVLELAVKVDAEVDEGREGREHGSRL